MKLKKVEISGFRLFDDPASATFNFISKSGKLANFVSIFAPEGFGKTSFYDAVEWGITKSISRFPALRNDWQMKSGDQLLNVRSLLRNRNTERETYVKIDTTGAKYYNRISESGLSESGKNESDSAPNYGEVEFNRVILPLSKISALITETDPEARFMKMIELPAFQTAGNYFHVLKQLYNISYHREDTGKLKLKSFKQPDSSNLSVGRAIGSLYDVYKKHLDSDMLKSIKEIDAENLNFSLDIKDHDAFVKDIYEKCREVVDTFENTNQSIISGQNKDLSAVRNFNESKIKSELDRTEKYLTEEIDNFFNKSLINELYQRIDQNPDFCAISFEVNLQSEKPRLDILVNENLVATIPRNDYNFSTAQVGSLTMAVFLASALTANNYDCIFIDDPFLSKGSINLLATIDLLRSIAFSHNKQIIFSTSDINLNSLLKKKMPPNLFNSRFLELESFGKLKKEEESIEEKKAEKERKQYEREQRRHEKERAWRERIVRQVVKLSKADRISKKPYEKRRSVGYPHISKYIKLRISRRGYGPRPEEEGNIPLSESKKREE